LAAAASAEEEGDTVDQRIIDLYDQYTHGGMERRAFLERLAHIAGGSAGAAALLARAQTIPENDARLETSRAEFDAAGVRINGYMAHLKGTARRPAVIVISENRGLTPHIQDVARRLAAEGFLALAPDMLSPLGGTPSNEEEAVKMIGTLKPPETTARLAAAVAFLAKHALGNGKVGVVGFCWGGGFVNQLAAAGTSLNAGVSYYGMQLPAADVPKISAPLMLHYAGLDERINAGIAAYEAALQADHKTYEKFLYEGANHAFNNDTNTARYNKEAAQLAWGRTLAFFKKYLAP
jgi:carboxymethylenebutenolidase